MDFRFKIRQYFNFSGINLIITNILKRTKPTLINDISQINEQFLINHKIKLVFIDKDNTITLPYENKFANENVENIVRLMQNNLGFNNVIIISNSIGSNDDKIKNIKLLENKELKILLLNHCMKKPNINIFSVLKNTDVDIEKQILDNKITKENIFVIGDRLFTDVYLAQLNGFKSILVNPLCKIKDNFAVRSIRKIESLLLKL